MDPNAALANLRDATGLASALADGDPVDYTAEQILADLAEAAEALDEWLSKGGFLPSAWAGRTGDPVIACRDCDHLLSQRPEKALSGETQMVWADEFDSWVCDVTGNEHRPGVTA